LDYFLRILPFSTILTSQQSTNYFKHSNSKMQILTIVTAFFLVALTNAFPIPPPEPWDMLTEHSPQVDQPKAPGHGTNSRHLPNQYPHGDTPAILDPLNQPKARNLPDHTDTLASPASTLVSRDLITVLLCETIDYIMKKKKCVVTPNTGIQFVPDSKLSTD
jgi:hypothetical protein